MFIWTKVIKYFWRRRATTRKIVLKILKKSQKMVIFAYFCEKKKRAGSILGGYFDTVFGAVFGIGF